MMTALCRAFAAGVLFVLCAALTPLHVAAATPQAPVVLYGSTLFVVGAPTDAAAQHRAALIAQRIAEVAADPTISVDAIAATVTPDGATIAAGSTVIVAITASDAAAVGRSVPETAQAATAIIRRAVQDERDERTPTSLALHAAIALATFVGLVLVTLLVWRLTSRLIGTFYGRSARLSAVGVAPGVEVPLRPLIEIAVSLLRVLRLVVVGFLSYLCVSFVLRQFLFTRDLASQLIGPFAAAISGFLTGFVSWLPQLAIIVVIGFIAYEAMTFLRVVRDEMQAGRFSVRGFESDWINPTYRLLVFAVVVFAVMAILPHVPGFDSPSFKAVGLLLSALFTFGSASTITNVLGGVVLTYAPSFRVGDYIKIGEAEGEVVSKTLFVTQIRTMKNVIITMPNASVIGATVYNYSAMALRGAAPLILNSTITIGYDVPWRDIEAALVAAALKTEHVVADPAPFVLQTALNDYNVAYQINAYSREPLALARTYSALHANIQDECNGRGIEILSPAYAALRDGNHSTIPERYLEAGYRAPGFRVERPEA